MANKATSSIKSCFDLNLTEDELKKFGMRLNWPRVAKKRESIRAHDDMRTLEVSFKFNFCRIL
jgi:hypothetical protein